LNESISLYIQGGTIESITNRAFYKGLENVINNIKFYGGGPYYFLAINGNSMVSHNYFYAIYAKFGIIGVILSVYYIKKVLKMILKKLKIAKRNLVRRKLLIYFVLLITLIIQELKISFIRNNTTILIYTFFFMVIYWQNISIIRDSIND